MSRPILSRPRTRVYGCNYDKGESYYKPMVDHLDRKYSGRPLFPEPRNSFADEIAARRSDIGTRDLAGTRHGAFGREPDLDFEARARAPFASDPFFGDNEDTVYDSRGQRTSRLRKLPLGQDFANEVSATTRKLKACVSALDADLEADSRMRSDFMEKSSKTAKSVLEDADMAFKRRSKFMDDISGEDRPTLTRWSKLLDSPEPLDDLTSGAAGRALRTKARLADLENEMEELAEKQAKRERRAAALRALVNETAEDSMLASQTRSRNLAGNRNDYDEMDFLHDYRDHSPEDESDEEYLLAQRRLKERAAAAFEEDLAELRRKRRDMQERLFDMVDIDAEIKKAKSTLANADVMFQRHAFKFDNADDDEFEMSLAKRMARRKQLEALEIPQQPKPKPTMWAKLVPAEEATFEPASPLRARLNSIIADSILTNNVEEKKDSKSRSKTARKKSVCF